MPQEDCRETQFLEGHKRRNDKLAKRHRNTDVLDAFWKVLRKSLNEWDNDLDALQLSTTITAKQRREVSGAFNHFEDTLKCLQRDSLAFDQVELPISDVRLLHKEFTQRATRLDRDREESCPSTKFLFHRYRAAMKEQYTQNVLNETPKSTRVQLRPKVIINKNAIHDLDNVAITEERNGRVTIQSESGKVSVWADTENNSPSSIILKNLRSCRVQISRPYKAIHLLNISHSRIVISQKVESAIHVSCCGHLELTASCHQLRLHESHHLQCHVKVGSGPILEGCSDILFFASSGTDLVRDTKDFNWLRNGVPSPNYSIVDTRIGLSRTDLLSLTVVQDKSPIPTSNITSASRYNSGEGAEDTTDESDDEL